MLEIQTDFIQKKFFAFIDDEECFLKFRHVEPGVVDFYSTYVPKELTGKGYAAQLAEFALRHAIAEHWKVIPSCSYVRGYIAKHPEYQNLVV